MELPRDGVGHRAATRSRNADSYVAIVAPENTLTAADIPAERLSARQGALREPHVPFLSDEKPWVGCYYPTAAAAQDAGLPLPCVRGLPLRRRADRLAGAAARRWSGIAEQFDAAPRRCGSSAPRPTSRSASRAARARSTRSARTCRAARSSTRPSRTRPKGSSAIRSIRPATSATRSAACASASRAARSSTPRRTSDEEFLLGTLDIDEGARRLGEFGIGCNPGIQRHMRNTLFDEKMEGTIHLAIGTGFPQLGGLNTSERPLGHGQGAPERRPDRARRQGRPGERRMAARRPPRRAVRAARSSSARSACSRAGR